LIILTQVQQIHRCASVALHCCKSYTKENCSSLELA